MGKRKTYSKREYFGIAAEELDGYVFPDSVLEHYIDCKRMMITGLKQATFLEFVGGKCMFVNATRQERATAEKFVKKVLTAIYGSCQDGPNVPSERSSTIN